jgi:hypothetical protein
LDKPRGWIAYSIMHVWIHNGLKNKLLLAELLSALRRLTDLPMDKLPGECLRKK